MALPRTDVLVLVEPPEDCARAGAEMRARARMLPRMTYDMRCPFRPPLGDRMRLGRGSVKIWPYLWQGGGGGTLQWADLLTKMQPDKRLQSASAAIATMVRDFI